MIPFNRFFLTGHEIEYISSALKLDKLSGNGHYTTLCHNFFKDNFHFRNALLTTSCTDALEMAAILIDIREGDEVIVPSFTFVSTANAFKLRGATIRFADSCVNNPNVDPISVKELITERTKAIVPVHYAGVACDMKALTDMAAKCNIHIIEDAAQAIDSKFGDNYLGSIGSFGTYSFHETKNISCGEGGLLIINNEDLMERSEIVWEKGTNRSAFFRGEIDKYQWVDIGSSFLPSEITAAFLLAQLENLEKIQEKRKALWRHYQARLIEISHSGDRFELQQVPSYSQSNGHLIYIVTRSLDERTSLIAFLRAKGIYAVFHYQSLHRSPYHRDSNRILPLPNSDRFSDQLIRLPLFYDLDINDVDYICDMINLFYSS